MPVAVAPRQEETQPMVFSGTPTSPVAVTPSPSAPVPQKITPEKAGDG